MAYSSKTYIYIYDTGSGILSALCQRYAHCLFSICDVLVFRKFSEIYFRYYHLLVPNTAYYSGLASVVSVELVRVYFVGRCAIFASRFTHPVFKIPKHNPVAFPINFHGSATLVAQKVCITHLYCQYALRNFFDNLCISEDFLHTKSPFYSIASSPHQFEGGLYLGIGFALS